MDDIHKNGLTVMFSTKDTHFGGPNHYPSIITPAAKEEGLFVEGQLALYKDHLTLFGEA